MPKAELRVGDGPCERYKSWNCNTAAAVELAMTGGCVPDVWACSRCCAATATVGSAREIHAMDLRGKESQIL